VIGGKNYRVLIVLASQQVEYLTASYKFIISRRIFKKRSGLLMADVSKNPPPAVYHGNIELSV